MTVAEPAPSAPAAPRLPMRRVLAGSISGAFLEWYDFNLYGLSAALVFARLFFPSFSPAAGTLAALATFGAGFVLRPVGGVVFGHFGDRVGRKATLVATMLVMGGSTFLVGVLPTYGQVGVAAPVLLVLLRLVQGFGLGGEYGGASLLTVEYAPARRRGLFGALPGCGAPLGYLVATGLFAAVSALPEPAFLAWGWRLPFLVSAALLVAGLVVRVRLLETPAFAAVRSRGAQERVPLLHLLATEPRRVLLTVGARFAEGISSNLFQPFTIAYLTGTLGFASSVGLAGAAVYNVVTLLLAPVFGALSDRYGRRRVYAGGAIAVGVFAFPYFLLIHGDAAVLVWVAMGVAALCGVPMAATQPTFFTELFDTRVRYSGLSVAYQLSAVLAGFTPALATAMANATGGGPWLPAGYLVLIAVVSAVCTLALPATNAGGRAPSLG